MKPLRVRIEQAWMVLRGIVDPDDLRAQYYAAEARADAEMQAHMATIELACARDERPRTAS